MLTGLDFGYPFRNSHDEKGNMDILIVLGDNDLLLKLQLRFVLTRLLCCYTVKERCCGCN